ncbi:hypothetical protein EON64_20030 [archaeon]|nr:MAG: hypothetical protein EON64_20030 [archaeon]
MTTLRFSGSAMFRERLVVSLLSRKPLVISNIRSNVEADPGLRDFEANFLRLLEKITDGKSGEVWRIVIIISEKASVCPQGAA